jgi:DNA-binding NarL/FixJ family response regulator
MGMIRVLVADDEPLITAGIRAVLASAEDIEVVAEAGDGRSAVELALAHRVDVALLDITMPVMDGLRTVEELRRLAPRVRTVMLTAFGEESNVRRALRGGVAGFVLKNCTPGELLGAVRAAAAGEAYLSPRVTRLVLGMVAVREDDGAQAARQRLAALTARETEVLDLVAEGLPNVEIARRLHLTETSIKTYVSRVLSKLGCANRVQAALLARDARTS